MKTKKTFKKFAARGPSGMMETMATSRMKAIANIRWRLVNECHMSSFDARTYDLSDCREIVD